jgi:hypothetical protein
MASTADLPYNIFCRRMLGINYWQITYSDFFGHFLTVLCPFSYGALSLIFRHSKDRMSPESPSTLRIGDISCTRVCNILFHVRLQPYIFDKYSCKCEPYSFRGNIYSSQRSFLSEMNSTCTDLLEFSLLVPIPRLCSQLTSAAWASFSIPLYVDAATRTPFVAIKVKTVP